MTDLAACRVPCRRRECARLDLYQDAQKPLERSVATACCVGMCT